MSEAITIVHERPSIWRWLVVVSRLGLIGMAIGLAIFYKSNELPLMLFGLLVFSLLALLQSDLALFTVLVTVPLFLIPAEITGLRDLPVRLPLHEVALLISTGAVVAHWLGRQIWSGNKPRMVFSGLLLPSAIRWSAVRYYIPAGLLIFTGILGVLWAVPEGRSAALRELRWLIIEPLLFYVLLTAAFRRPGALGRRNQAYALGAFILSGTLVAVIGLLQFVGIDLVWLFGTKQVMVASIVAEPVLWRVNSVYGSPNNLGLYIGRVWPLAVALLMFTLSARPLRAHRRAHTWFLAAATVLCLVGLAVSFSRGAWLGAGAALVVLALPRIGWRWSRRMMLACVALAATLALIIALVLSIRGGLVGANALMRLSFWREALWLIQLHPLGIGLDQFFYYHNPVYGRSLLSPLELAAVDSTAAHPHNLFLDIWLRLGPLGSAAFAWLILRFIRQTSATASAAPNAYTAACACGARAAMAAALVHGLVDNFYFVPDLAFAFWLLLALAEAPHTE